MRTNAYIEGGGLLELITPRILGGGELTPITPPYIRLCPHILSHTLVIAVLRVLSLLVTPYKS